MAYNNNSDGHLNRYKGRSDSSTCVKKNSSSGDNLSSSSKYSSQGSVFKKSEEYDTVVFGVIKDTGSIKGTNVCSYGNFDRGINDTGYNSSSANSYPYSFPEYYNQKLPVVSDRKNSLDHRYTGDYNLQRHTGSNDYSEQFEQCKTQMEEERNIVKQALDRYQHNTMYILQTMEENLKPETKLINNSNLEYLRPFRNDSTEVFKSDYNLSSNTVGDLKTITETQIRTGSPEAMMPGKRNQKIKTTNQHWLVCKDTTEKQNRPDNYWTEKISLIQSDVLPKTSIVNKLELEHSPRVVQCMNDGTLVVLMENKLLYKILEDNSIEFDYNIEDISYCPKTNTLFCLCYVANETYVYTIDTLRSRLTRLFDLTSKNTKITYIGTSVNANFVFCGDTVVSKKILSSLRSKDNATDTSIVNKITVRTRANGKCIARKKFKQLICNITVCKSTGKVALTYFDECKHQRRPYVHVMDTYLINLYMVTGPSYTDNKLLIPRTIFDANAHLITADNGQLHLFQANSGDYIKQIQPPETSILASCLAMSFDGHLLVGQCFSRDLHYIKYQRDNINRINVTNRSFTISDRQTNVYV